MKTLVIPDQAKLERRIAGLLQKHHPESGEFIVSDLRQVFGGNARQAWAFDVDFYASGEKKHVPCILLAQVAGGHVESSATAEYQVLAALTGRGIRAPAVVALDADGEITGMPAIVLERVEGVAGAVAFLEPVDPGISVALTEELAEVTADLHAFDWRKAGLAAPDGDAPLRQINMWENRYREGRLIAHPPLSYMFGWLRDHVPPPPRLSLVHGDLRPGNFLCEGRHVTALLDWEMAHVGDPAEDIAWIYRALWSPGKFVSLDRFLDIYRARCGIMLDPRHVTFYRIFSEVKFATLSIVASSSVASGRSLNMRHADRAAKVPGALAQCFAWIGKYDWNDCHAAA